MKRHIIYGLCVLALSWGCTSASKQAGGHTHDHEHSHDDHEHDHEHDHDNEIVFTTAQAEAAGLKTVTVHPEPFGQIIKTSGQVVSSAEDEITIPATTNGIVTFSKAAVNAGQSIRAGESLATVSSKNMLNGDPILKAEAAFRIAEKEYQRAEALVSDKLISEKEYNEIKLAYENARIAYEGSAGKTTAKGTNITAPVSGYIKSRLVGEGEYVEAGQPLIVITRNRRLQLRADVSESHYKDLRTITSANFKTPYSETVYRLADMNGRLVSYGKSAGGSYYIPVYFEFDNVGDIFPGAYVDVYLLGQLRKEVLTVPVSSLTEDQGMFFVYVREHGESYEKREVKTGVSDGERIEIVSGLKPGETVVSHGAYHIRLATATASIPHGHEH